MKNNTLSPQRYAVLTVLIVFATAGAICSLSAVVFAAGAFGSVEGIVDSTPTRIAAGIAAVLGSYVAVQYFKLAKKLMP